MIMDYLESGYYGWMRLHRDSDQLTKVRWYRAAPTAKVFPFPHAFASYVWDKVLGWPEPIELGEVGRIAYAPSGPLLKPPGIEFHGDPSWFVEGIPPGYEHVPSERCLHVPDAFCLLLENFGELLLEKSPGCIEVEH